MKKLIKFTVLIAIVAIFSFSSNPVITKVRTVTIEKGKELFQKGVSEMKASDNDTVSKIGEVIE